MQRYSVFHSDLLPCLFRTEFADEFSALPDDVRQEPELTFFQNFVAYNFKEIARKYQCDVEIDPVRTYDAHEFWKDDLARILDRMKDTERLDEYKRAGFLSFWLRRRVVVNEILPLTPYAAGATYPKPVQDFIIYGNEIAAFLLGYYFCLRFQMSARNPGELARIEEAYQLEDVFVKDVSVYLKTKEVSPHALYLIYKSIFR